MMVTANVQAVPDIESVIRQAIIAEIGEKADRNAEELQKAREYLDGLRARIVETRELLANLIADEKDCVALIRQFELDEKLIEQRVQAALAAMRGEKITRTRTQTGGSRTGSASSVQFDAMVNGKPRQYKDLTKLTYDMSKKLGRRIVTKDIFDAFESQAGIRLFSSEHQESGMVTIDLDGIELGIAVR